VTRNGPPDPPASSWIRDFDLPSQLFGIGTDDDELYEEDGEFVLTVDMPGFEPGEIDVTWDDGRLNIAAEHADEARSRTPDGSRRSPPRRLKRATR